MPEPDYPNSYLDVIFRSLNDDIKQLADRIKKVEEDLETKYVRLERYINVERLIYGLVGLMLTAVVIALLSLVIKST